MMVGATVRGPIYLSNTLTIPVAPIAISNMAATIIDPVSWFFPEKENAETEIHFRQVS